MTLNITLMTSAYIIQASDRRMVSIPDGQVIDDEANKSVVLQADDGIFAITFAGVGRYGNKRVDRWLADRMLDEGVPELPVRQGVDVIARVAGDWFRAMRGKFDRRHLFVIAGWIMSGAKPQPAAWTVTNWPQDDGSATGDSVSDEFRVEEAPVRRKGASVCVTGQPQAVDRGDRRRLEATLRKSPRMDRVEQALVGMIRAAAAKTRWARVINRNVLAIALAPGGQCRATYHPASAPAYNYAPIFVWYERGLNFMVGDAEIDLNPNFAYRFGKTMLVGAPGGAGPQMQFPSRDKVKLGGWTRVSNAKYKKETPAKGDLQILFEIIPLRDRMR